MVRALLHLLLGWVLLASVAGLGHNLGLTVMLPATSAVLVARLAFARGADQALSLPLGLAVAIALGYLEDIHQGTPVGVLCLAHALAFLATVWTATRIAVEGAVVRALAAGLVAGLVDLLTFAELMLLADPLGVDPRALLGGLPAVRWHILATVLAAPAVWLLADGVLGGWDRMVGRRPQQPRPLAAASWYRS